MVLVPCIFTTLWIFAHFSVVRAAISTESLIRAECEEEGQERAGACDPRLGARGHHALLQSKSVTSRTSITTVEYVSESTGSLEDSDPDHEAALSSSGSAATDGPVAENITSVAVWDNETKTWVEEAEGDTHANGGEPASHEGEEHADQEEEEHVDHVDHFGVSSEGDNGNSSVAEDGSAGVDAVTSEGHSTSGSDSHGDHSDLGGVVEHGDTGGHDLTPEQKSASVALACMLLGTVAFVMSLFYLVHSHNRRVRNATWYILSEAVSIFMAVLIFSSLKMSFVDFFGEATGDHHAAPDVYTLILSFFRLTVIFAGEHALLLYYRFRTEPLEVIGTVGAHVVGFAAIDAWGSMMQKWPFSYSPWLAAVGLLPVTAGMVMSSMIAEVARTRLARIMAAQEDMHFRQHHAMERILEHLTHEHEQWSEQCIKSEDEAAGLCLGFLISLIIRFAITNQLPPVHGNPHDKTEDQVALLASASCCVGVTLVIVALILHWVTRKYPGPRADRFSEVIKKTLAMAMGWCFLYSGQWFFWTATQGEGIGTGDKMTGRMVMAMCFTVCVYVCIFTLDWARQRIPSLWTLSTGLVLLLGLSWEAAFQQAVEGVGSLYEGHYQTLSFVLLTGGLCALVLPAWALYILPRAAEAEKDFD